MKKFVRIVSLSVALCLCCCFSTFGNVKASALTIYDTEVVVPGGTGSTSAALWVDTGNTDRVEINDAYYFDFTATAGNTDSLSLAFTGHSWDIALDTENYDYWVQMIVEADKTMTYFPTTFSATKYQSTTTSSANVTVSLSDVKISQYDGVQGASFMNRFTCIGKLPDNFEGNFRTIATTGSVGSIPSKVSVFVAVHRFVKGTDTDSVAALIAAINNQTNTLNGSINQAADDIQQSIEDQYQMEEEEDFGFSDIQEQYEEKMGVLTFGTETTLQMLDLFSPSNAGEAYIRVPGWSMDIQGETYNVWNEYTFYFSWIEDWIPLLVRLMRTFNVTMFYIAILMYINKVYERNFLAK